MATPFMLSHDNIELQFATNHLGIQSVKIHLMFLYKERFHEGVRLKYWR